MSRDMVSALEHENHELKQENALLKDALVTIRGMIRIALDEED